MNGRCNPHPILGTAEIIFALPTALTAALVLIAAGPTAAQPGWVLSHQKISDTEGGFTGTLDDRDEFGRSVASLDDLDGDGVGDLAVGAWTDDDGGTDRGAVWVLFLNTDGTVKSHQKISDTEGGFTGTLDDDDLFGTSVASLGDLDGDGVADLAVGATGDDDGGRDRGAVWVLFLAGVGGDACQYILKKDSKPAGDCEACPVKGDVVASKQNCEKKRECDKKLKGKIPCPDGGRGSCKKIKGKRTGYG